VLVNNAAGNFTVLAAKHLVTDWAMKAWDHSSIMINRLLRSLVLGST
jgi:hypothetical protein